MSVSKQKGDNDAESIVATGANRVLPKVRSRGRKSKGSNKGKDVCGDAKSSVSPMEQKAVATAEIVEKGGMEPGAGNQTPVIKYNKQSPSQESTEFSRSAVILSQYAKNPTDADIRSELRGRGEAVLQASMQLTEKYFWLCDWIVTQQIRPETVSEELRRIGMRKERIAEIKRVCYTSRQIYQDFKTKLIGWKTALLRARASRESKETDHTKWLQLFRDFEKQFMRCPPPGPCYSGSGKNLLMWSDADITDSAYQQTCGRWVVSVRAKST